MWVVKEFNDRMVDGILVEEIEGREVSEENIVLV